MDLIFAEKNELICNFGYIEIVESLAIDPQKNVLNILVSKCRIFNIKNGIKECDQNTWPSLKINLEASQMNFKILFLV